MVGDQPNAGAVRHHRGGHYLRPSRDHRPAPAGDGPGRGGPDEGPQVGPGTLKNKFPFNSILIHFILRKDLPYRQCLNLMEYDRGDSFPFDFEPNGIQFDSESKGKLSSRSYSINFER